MKIKSGAARFQRTSKAAKTQSTQSADAADFSGMIQDEPESKERESKTRSALMEMLGDLARAVEAGKTSKEEASRQFVGLVIEERYGSDQSKGAARMQESIADMVEDDPRFVTQLHSQLKKLAKA